MFGFSFVMIGMFTICQSQIIPIEQYKQQLLDLHNNYRSMQKASDMQELTWDDALANEAQEWVEQCKFAHQRKSRGENLAFDNFKNKPVEEKINSSLKSWYDEINTYNYYAKACGSSCHYVQMVWAKTRKVGCAMKECEKLTYGANNAWYLVCFYFPKGNDASQYPYNKTGQACSECLEGQNCNEEGLCAGGPEVDLNPCENNNDMCKQWKLNGQCNSNRKYMELECAKACGFCTKAGQEEQEEECEDADQQCPSWAQSGECQRNPRYMNVSCRKSCNAC